MRKFDNSRGVEVQISPPHTHRKNAAERNIRTFKNHFVAGLCSTHKTFPLYLWYLLLPQAQLTLNLLRPYKVDERILAYEALEVPYDFNKTPIAVPGAKIIAHVNPSQRRARGPHGEHGFYVGPAMHHYRY